MRLHHLQITAFGPYGETVDVDFDHLSQAGLFLLSGATGSGKTSVLDAVTFALYGAVPGDRNAAKRLRSDHAPALARPEVVLEATLAARRFRITRSPAWDRPKKRGTGLTSEPTAVSLSEQVEGHWRHLSSRADETGQIISDLVGMNLTQFTQVALLPQGQFQAFLRATSEERHHLLQRLFRTGRFESVETWLREHRLSLRRETTDAHHALAEVVSRISEVVVDPLPDDWQLGDLSLPATDGSLVGWLHHHHREVGAQLLTSRESLAEASDVEESAESIKRHAEKVCERRGRLRAAVAEKAALQEQAVDHLYRRERLDLARRATGLADLLELAADSCNQRDTTDMAAREHLAAAATAGVDFSHTEDPGPREEDMSGQLILDWDLAAPARPAGDPVELLRDDPDALVTHLQAAIDVAGDRVSDLRLQLPRALRRTQIREEVARLRRRRVQAEGHRDELSAQITAQSDELDRLTLALTAAGRLAGQAESLTEQIDASSARLAARTQCLDLIASIAAATERQGVAIQRAQDLREVWLHLKETRLESMAAEIAGQLAVGACCPVCGSADHPDKARRDDLAPDAAQEKAALKVMEDAKAEAHAREGAVRDLETQLALAEQRAGTQSAEDAHEAHGCLEKQATQAREAAAQVDRLTEQRRRMEILGQQSAEALSARAPEIVDLDVTLRELATEGDSIDADLHRVLDGADSSALPGLVESAQERLRSGRAALEAVRAFAVAGAQAREVTDRLDRALARAGFNTAAAARSALLSADEVIALDEAVRHHDTHLDAVRRLLAEPGVQDELSAPAPDLEALTGEHTRAREATASHREASVLLASRAQRLRDLASTLAEAHQTWEPLHEQWLLASSLSAFVEGKAADNRWHMRLSAYVLAYRLSQVVDAANERLARMSDQRYSLVHTGQRGAGEKRGGLSLLVRDDWSGETRDPATLSGGETFVVSLALALGLADVITTETGGMRLDTLFVDEGFGTLDAETLDGVMDTLDSLRDGGRVVGVVSHVAEMRDRIPTQLLVHKARGGSTLSVRG